jgi:hypothetical protein
LRGTVRMVQVEFTSMSSIAAKFGLQVLP